MIILDYLYIYFFENGLVVSVQPLYRWGRFEKAQLFSWAFFIKIL